jgi:hypothetical protein
VEGWEDRDGKTYYNSGSGLLVSSALMDHEGETYFLDSEGVLQKDSVFVFNDGKYYADPEGKILKDCIVEHGGKTYVIRPSCNYVEGQLDGVKADVLFLGLTGLSKESAAWQRTFFAETVDRTKPALVIPLHWDKFFCPLYGAVRGMPRVADDTGLSMHLLAAHCAAVGTDCVVQLPLTTLTLFE